MNNWGVTSLSRVPPGQSLLQRPPSHFVREPRVKLPGFQTTHPLCTAYLPPSAGPEADLWEVCKGPRATFGSCRENLYPLKMLQAEELGHTMLSCQARPVQTQPRVWATDLTSHSWQQSCRGTPMGYRDLWMGSLDLLQKWGLGLLWVL